MRLEGRRHALYLGAAAVLLCCSGARAQVNTEALAAEVNAAGPRLTLAGSGGFASGNVDVIEWRTDMAFDFATAHAEAPNERLWFRDRVLVHGNFGQKRVSGNTAVNTGFGHVRYTRMLVPRVGPEAFGQAQYDQQRKLRWRTLAGGGLRAVALNRERIGLWGGTGYMAEWERRDADVVPERMLNHRWSSYLTLAAVLVPERASFVTTAYVQPRLDRFRDLQVLTEAQLRLSITDALRFSVNGSIRHDSEPPNGVEPTDVRIQGSLVLTLAPAAEE